MVSKNHVTYLVKDFDPASLQSVIAMAEDAGDNINRIKLTIRRPTWFEQRVRGYDTRSTIIEATPQSKKYWTRAIKDFKQAFDDRFSSAVGEYEIRASTTRPRGNEVLVGTTIVDLDPHLVGKPEEDADRAVLALEDLQVKALAYLGPQTQALLANVVEKAVFVHANSESISVGAEKYRARALSEHNIPESLTNFLAAERSNKLRPVLINGRTPEAELSAQLAKIEQALDVLVDRVGGDVARSFAEHGRFLNEVLDQDTTVNWL